MGFEWFNSTEPLFPNGVKPRLTFVPKASSRPDPGIDGPRKTTFWTAEEAWQEHERRRLVREQREARYPKRKIALREPGSMFDPDDPEFDPANLEIRSLEVSACGGETARYMEMLRDCLKG